MLIPIVTSLPPTRKGVPAISSRGSSNRWQAASASAGGMSLKITRNSSPPILPRTSPSRSSPCSRSAHSRRSSSPASWP